MLNVISLIVWHCLQHEGFVTGHPACSSTAGLTLLPRAPRVPALLQQARELEPVMKYLGREVRRYYGPMSQRAEVRTASD